MDKKKIVIFLLAVIAVTVMVNMIGLYRRNELQKRIMPDSYGTSKSGYKAIFLLLKKLGYRVKRIGFTPDQMERRELRQLIILSPFADTLDVERTREIYDWVMKGNRILIADSQNNKFWKMLGVKIKITAASQTKEITTSGVDSALRGVSSVVVKGKKRFRLPPRDSHPFHVHLKDKYGVICASTRVGNGEFVILSTPEMFNNENVNKKDNVIFLTNLLQEPGMYSLGFEESVHHHFQTPGEFSFSPVFRAILLQLAVVLLIFYTVFLKRFGKPIPLKKQQSRASVEYIYSLGGLFQKAKSSKFVMDNLLRGTYRRLKGSYSTVETSSYDVQQVLKSIENTPGFARDRFIGIIKKYRNLSRKDKISDKELLDMSRNLEKFIIQSFSVNQCKKES